MFVEIEEPLVETYQDAAATARAREDHRRLTICDEIERLIAGVRDEHPEARICELAPYLNKSDSQRLMVLLTKAQDFITYPLQPTQ